MSSSSNQGLAHVLLLPSAGMGHLTPFLRLASSLELHNVQVSFIIPNPTVSMAESQALSLFFASYPQIMRKELNLLPLEKQPSSSNDPFYHHFEVICHSIHLLPPLLSSLSPPVSAVVTDMSLLSKVLPITQALNLPNYVFFTSSANMLTLFVSFHTIDGSKDVSNSGDQADFTKIPGAGLIPTSWIPPQLLQESKNSFKTYLIENGKKMLESNGIIVNTFRGNEHEILAKLNSGKVIRGLPEVTAIGPLPPCNFEKTQPLAWLENQEVKSVVYVSFGSRIAMSRQQVRELGDGLIKSGKKFLWVVKDRKVDREDNEEIEDIIGYQLMERMKENGLAVKNWINQEYVLSHPAIGGFLSHCGWNSVTEAIWHGVPILAWPHLGDQKINADIVERAGIGMWEKSWGWGGEMVVNAEGIARKIKEMMENKTLRIRTISMREEARRIVAGRGTYGTGLRELIQMWKKE